jgi:magnesium transporter
MKQEISIIFRGMIMKCYQIENDTLAETENRFENNTICVCSGDELLRQNLKFAPHTIEECSRTGSAKLESYDGYDFILLNVINDDNPYSTHRIGLYVTPQMILFVCDRPSGAVQGILDAFTQTKTNNLNLARVLYAFFNSLTSNDSEELEAIEEDISAIEERVIRGEEEDYIKDIVSMRKKLMFYKKYYEQLLDVAESIEENQNGILSSGALRYFKMFTARVDRLNRNILNLRDYITQVREAYQSQVDIGLNSIMKLFTVITAIFLPLTLLVGWYGMNFKNMPELQWPYGYLLAIILALAFVVSSIIYFKKRKIL